jgi:Xaa-Pro dipeptidase
VERGFPPAEYEARWSRVSVAMTEAGLDAVLVTSEANFRYFSGFDSQTWVSPTRPRYLVLRRDNEPVAVVPASNVSGMRERTPIADIRWWNAPNPTDEGVSAVTAALCDSARRFGAIGAELGPESRLGMPAGDFLRLIEALRPIETRDAARLMTAMRMVKSPLEVEKIERIAGIVSEGFAALPHISSGSRSVRDLCRRLSVELLSRGADKVAYLVGEAGQGGYETIMMGPADYALTAGDIVFIDTGCQFDGYFCDFNRNYAVGRPTDIASDAHQTIFRATDAGIAAVRPGRSANEVWQAMADVVEKRGRLTGYVGRMGHGVGLSLTEPPSIHPDDETVLVPGMILTLEPSMTYPYSGSHGSVAKLMVHEENILVTEDGCRLLSRRAPIDIPRLDAAEG